MTIQYSNWVGPVFICGFRVAATLAFLDRPWTPGAQKRANRALSDSCINGPAAAFLPLAFGRFPKRVFGSAGASLLLAEQTKVIFLFWPPGVRQTAEMREEKKLKAATAPKFWAGGTKLPF